MANMDSSPSILAKGGSLVDLPDDFEFRLEFDIEEDIEGELDDFVRLARLGLVKQAREYFQGALSDHLKLFPVFAEYAEFLIEEGAYPELFDILQICRNDYSFSDEEYSLVRLLEALVLTRTDPGDESSLHVAQDWLDDQTLDDLQQIDEITVKSSPFQSHIRTDFFVDTMFRNMSCHCIVFSREKSLRKGRRILSAQLTIERTSCTHVPPSTPQ